MPDAASQTARDRSEHSDRNVLVRVAQGEAEAMDACMDRYGGLVWSLIRRQIRSDPEAEDAAQDIFLDVWKSAPRFDPAIASEVTFIAMIARRRLIDRRRRVAGSREHAVLDDGPPPPADGLSLAPERSDDARSALEAFGRLSAEQQRVLRLSIQHGLSHEGIAQATGLPLGTVKTHARRGLIRLRALMDEGTGQ